jgi:Domain of unknown function (DUF4440)
MKKFFTYTIMVSLVAIVSSFADDKDAVKANENAAWQAYKDKNAAGFQKVVDKDIRIVGAEGMSNMQKELDDMKVWDIKSFAISNWDAFSDEADVIVATYDVMLQATANGKDISGNYHCGSVWKKEGADWLGIFHSSVKAEPAAK